VSVAEWFWTSCPTTEGDRLEIDFGFRAQVRNPHTATTILPDTLRLLLFRTRSRAKASRTVTRGATFSYALEVRHCPHPRCRRSKRLVPPSQRHLTPSTQAMASAHERHVRCALSHTPNTLSFESDRACGNRAPPRAHVASPRCRPRKKKHKTATGTHAGHAGAPSRS